MRKFKPANMNKMLADLQMLKEMQKQTNQVLTILISICEDGTLDVNAIFNNGKKYWMKNKNVENIDDVMKLFPDIKDNAPMILDDMLLETDMYLPTEIILYKGKETVQRFIDLVQNHNEEDYMEAYIELFNEEFGIVEPDLEHLADHYGEYDYQFGAYVDPCVKAKNLEELKANRLKRYQEACNITKDFLEQHDPVLADLFENYKNLSVQELVERYKDVRFFNKI